ncbi:ABC transporter ATP-binding protein [Limnoglobus roseus]|uniref:ABC transporter ATP-binding protein n=1 Tax=Limnoglobus roseus TaxID=2598579 RepID=A0A5C1A8T4_9BACT|nr:ABC transporter ATP-binding protein [Limnoglobus roseus]QEL13508.1 ABC transporter ATP-binding protein [Limnoglobus roseus]
MSYLNLNGVSKGFRSASGGRTEVLHDAWLSMERGEFVAVVGFSGAGKTTLMNMVAGLATPDSGTVQLEGETITGPGPDRMLVFQNYSLLPWMTAFENVKLAVDQVFPQWDNKWRREHTENYLKMVSLGHAMDRKPSQLSGGMRQRVCVARALACEPRILLLDEPFGALDALTRGTLQDELMKIRSQDDRTILMITNDVDEAILVADRIIPLTAGPRATLGPSFTVDIERPRDRKEINHDSRFKKLRKDVNDFLLGSAADKRNPVKVPAKVPSFGGTPVGVSA